MLFFHIFVFQDLIDHFKVDIVVHGSTEIAKDYLSGGDPYEVPKQLDRFKTLSSGNDMTTEKIVDRIIRNRLDFEQRNIKKEAKELAVLEAMEKMRATAE